MKYPTESKIHPEVLRQTSMLTEFCKSLRKFCSQLLIPLVTVVVAGLTLPLSAQDSDGASEESESAAVDEVITVIATRSERSIDEVAATVDVKTSKDIDREMVQSIADLVRFIPGVSVTGTGRYGLTGFRVRGIGGNRVLTLIDGVRVPDEHSFGPFLSARRDFVDTDSLQRVDIVRGPNSALHGSDALGGIVAFQSKRPNDYLQNENTVGSSVKLGFNSASDSQTVTLGIAGRQDRISGLLSYTSRNGSEMTNKGELGGTGPTRELPDPQDSTVQNLELKLFLDVAPDHMVEFGFSNFDSENIGDVLSDYGISTGSTLIRERTAVDARTRQLLSLRYNASWSTELFDRFHATWYQQTSTTDQRTAEQVAIHGAIPGSRTRDSIFEQNVSGTSVQLQKKIQLTDIQHTLIYGMDYYRTENTSLRAGGTFDLAGNPVFEFFPFPTRNFPLTETNHLGLFVHNEIAFADGRITVSPGLRYENFEGTTNTDQIYLQGNPGAPIPIDYQDDEITFKTGVVWFLSEELSVFGAFNEGFRAPPYDDVNIGLTHVIAGYKTISNPDLVSERSTGFEGGIKLSGASENSNLSWRVSFTMYHNRYENFIESLAVAPEFLASGGFDPSDRLITFQSINLNEVEINGWEAQGAFNTTNGFTVRAALSASEAVDINADNPLAILQSQLSRASGVDLGADQSLAIIDPASAIVGWGFRSPSDNWYAELVLTLVAGKSEPDINPVVARRPTSGYGTVDFLFEKKFRDNISVNVGVFNLNDKRYLRWQDTSSIGLDAWQRFTQPGRHFSGTLRWQW